MTPKDIEAPLLENQAAGGVLLTPTEKMLTSIIAETLERQSINLSDDFLRLGGQSIKAISVVNRVREATGVEIPVQLLLDGETTVRSISEKIDIANAEIPRDDET